MDTKTLNYVYVNNRYFEVGGTLVESKNCERYEIVELQLLGFIVKNKFNSFEYISKQFLGNYEHFRRIRST